MSEQALQLTDKQKEIFATWYALCGDDLATLLHCINKVALIPHLDQRYHLNPNEAEFLLTLSDLIYQLENNKP